MYIEPAQYLDLTQRITVLTKTITSQNTQNIKLKQTQISLKQKISFLQKRVLQLTNQLQKQKLGLKQHITQKKQQIIGHITVEKQNQKKFIQEQIGKVRNWSAINTLKQLEDRIAENKTTSAQKEFYEKVKTLYVLDRKKVGCNSIELFDWVNQLAKFKKTLQADPLMDINDISKILPNGTQKSIKKMQSNISQSKAPGNRNLNQSKIGKSQVKTQNQPAKNLSIVDQRITTKKDTLLELSITQKPKQDPLENTQIAQKMEKKQRSVKIL